jgi:hypothetical protein
MGSCSEVVLPDKGEVQSNSNARWVRAREIFDEIQSAPAAERDFLLKRRSGDDLELLAELRSLLDASDAEEALNSSLSETQDIQKELSMIHKSVGPYKLDRLIGRGGMGAVYLAHREDGQFEQQVAVKLIDVPVVTDLFRKQFRMERQILAGLNHPFIARMLDGGVSSEGELYLVLEYVEGVSILDYCYNQNLSLRGRLILFKGVCSAVQYAHQNLVIHRDLKPDNILVQQDGTPRLLDFGTAKLLNPLGETNSELTRQGLRSFTPQYASPEQVLGKAVSTSTDVYSLGVILFQLVTGVPPYELRDFSTEEMLRVICQELPPRPSTVARSEWRPDADLDAIILMSLRKDPDERYLTVDQFAADIQAWLDQRPIAARRGTLRYRVGKFAKRNKLAIGAAGLLILIVMIGIAGILWQSRAANLERISAQENAQEMRDLSTSFLSEIDEAVRELPGPIPVRHLMVKRVLDHLDHLAENSLGDRMTQRYLVNAYIHLGNLQGNQYEQNIGDGPGGLASINKAVALAESLRQENRGDRTLLELLALAYKTRGMILFGIGRPQEAVVSVNQAIAIQTELIASPDSRTSQIMDCADSYHLLGDELGEPETPSLGDYGGALAAYKKSTDLYERALQQNGNLARARREIAINYVSNASILLYTDPARAIESINMSASLWAALPASERSSKDDKRTMLYQTYFLARTLREAGEYTRAIAAYEDARKSIAVNVSSDSQDSQAQTDLVGLLGEQADVYIDLMNPLFNPRSQEQMRQNSEHAARLLRESTSVTKKLVNIDPSNQMWSAYLAYEEVRLGTLKAYPGSGRDVDLADRGIAQLHKLASADGISSEVLLRATTAMLTELPERLRDPELTVRYAERLANLSHHTDPAALVLLAQAYAGDRQFEKARATAEEGLRLLAPQPPAAPVPRSRVLFDHIRSQRISSAAESGGSRR